MKKRPAASADAALKPKRFALYWCTTDDGDEDWFVVASSASRARRFHEQAEGYDVDDAMAERIAFLPPELVRPDAWKDPKRKTWRKSAYWPSDELLIACGAEIGQSKRDELRKQVGVVGKFVRIGGRMFRAGDIIANTTERMGLESPPALAVFRGGKK